MSTKLKWLFACDLYENANVSQVKICSNHFKDTDFIDPNACKSGKHLKPGSFPTVNVPRQYCLEKFEFDETVEENTVYIPEIAFPSNFKSECEGSSCSC